LPYTYVNDKTSYKGDNMNKLIICIASLLTLSAGGKSSREIELESDNERLSSRVSQIESQLSDVRDKAGDVETASDEMVEQVSRFESEDWKDVVPSVQSASSDVEDAQMALSSAVEE